MTQGQRLLAALRRKPHTYMQMQMLGISTCPHKRLAESLHYLKEGERIVRRVNGRGLVEWACVRT